MSDKFWKFIERFKILAELTATLVVVIPVLYVLLQQGLAATIPVWLVLLITVFAVFLGYMLGRRPSASFLPMATTHKGRLLQKIDFDYPDSPTIHGWYIGESTDETQPAFKHFLDGFVGNALEIKSMVRYRMDLDIDQIAGLGRHVEFAVKLEGESYVMLRTLVHSKGKAKSRQLWLSLYAGNGQTKRIDDGSDTWFEYVVPVMPSRMEGGWGVFQIDLNDAVKKTAGNLGWAYGQLERIRFRGNLPIAHVSVSE